MGVGVSDGGATVSELEGIGGGEGGGMHVLWKQTQKEGWAICAESLSLYVLSSSSHSLCLSPSP